MAWSSPLRRWLWLQSTPTVGWGAWNARAEKVLAVSGGDIEGHSIFDFPLPWNCDEVNAAVRSCLDFGEAVYIDHVRFRLPDGQHGALKMSLQPIVDGQACVGVLLQANDVTERDALEARVLTDTPFATIGRMAPGIAHEINNPVSFIGNNIATLSQYMGDIKLILNASRGLAEACEGGGDEAKKRACLLHENWNELGMDAILDDLDGLIAETLDGVDRIRLIALGLKEFSRADSRGEIKEIDLNVCLDRTLVFARNEIKYKADVKKQYCKLPMYRCRPDDIRQAFLQLLLMTAESIDGYCDLCIATLATTEALIVDFLIPVDEPKADKCRRALACGASKREDKGWQLVKQILSDHGAKLILDDEGTPGRILRVGFPLKPACGIAATGRGRHRD